MTKETAKHRITKAVLEQLPEESRIPLEEALKTWWYNIRKEGGLRLSNLGNFSFIMAEIEHFDLPFPTKKDGQVINIHKFMLELNNKVPCPYYIHSSNKDKKPYIRVYDSKVAMLITLYGDIFDYVAATKRRK